MSEDINYEFLWEILQKERASNSLQLIPKSFYNDIFDFVKKQELSGVKNEEKATLTNNIKRLETEIFEKRKQKILLYVAYKKPLPSPITEIESNLYRMVMDLDINTRLSESQTLPETKNRLVVVVDKLPEVFLPSGTKLGPLDKGQSVEIKDKDDVAFLIDNSLCVYEKL